MPREIGWVKLPTGNTNLFAVLINRSQGADNGKIWNVTLSQWDAISGVAAGDYDVPLTEIFTEWYAANLPAGLAITDDLEWVVMDHGGGSPLLTNVVMAVDRIGDTGVTDGLEFDDSTTGWLQLPTGNVNLYMVIFYKDEDEAADYNRIWDDTAKDWVDAAAANWGNYAVAVSEVGAGVGWYKGTIPTEITERTVQVVILDHGGSAPASDDVDIAFARLNVIGESSSSFSSQSSISSSLSSSSASSRSSVESSSSPSSVSSSSSSISTSSASSSSFSSTSSQSSSSGSSSSVSTSQSESSSSSPNLTASTATTSTLLVATQNRWIAWDFSLINTSGEAFRPAATDKVRAIIGREGQTAADLVVTSGTVTSNGSSFKISGASRLRLAGADMTMAPGIYTLLIEQLDVSDNNEWKEIDRFILYVQAGLPST